MLHRELFLYAKSEWAKNAPDFIKYLHGFYNLRSFFTDNTLILHCALQLRKHLTENLKQEVGKLYKN